MTVLRRVYLYCDHADCQWHDTPFFQEGHRTAVAAREAGSEYAWVIWGGAADYCADHATENARVESRLEKLLRTPAKKRGRTPRKKSGKRTD